MEQFELPTSDPTLFIPRLNITGGAIGQGLPVAVGAAVAAPDRKVICLTGDGAGMYTVQSLWTMARERLPILTVVFSNRSYLILNIEMSRTGAGAPGPSASSMLSLDDPPIDWVAMAKGHGVEAEACRTAEEFEAVYKREIGSGRPFLIEAII